MKNHIVYHTVDSKIYRDEVEAWCTCYATGIIRWQVWENGRKVAHCLTREKLREFLTRYAGGVWEKGAL